MDELVKNTAKKLITKNILKTEAAGIASQIKSQNKKTIIFSSILLIACVCFSIFDDIYGGIGFMAIIIGITAFILIRRSKKSKKLQNALNCEIDANRFKIYKTRLNAVVSDCINFFTLYDNDENGKQITLKDSACFFKNNFGKIFYIVYIGDRIERFSADEYEPDCELSLYVRDVSDPDGNVQPVTSYLLSSLIRCDILANLRNEWLYLIPAEVKQTNDFNSDAGHDYYVNFGKSERFGKKYVMTVGEYAFGGWNVGDPVWIFSDKKGKVALALNRECCVLSDELNSFVRNDPDLVGYTPKELKEIKKNNT